VSDLLEMLANKPVKVTKKREATRRRENKAGTWEED
jgi:hypothetical protein